MNIIDIILLFSSIKDFNLRNNIREFFRVDSKNFPIKYTRLVKPWNVFVLKILGCHRQQIVSNANLYLQVNMRSFFKSRPFLNCCCKILDVIVELDCICKFVKWPRLVSLVLGTCALNTCKYVTTFFCVTDQYKMSPWQFCLCAYLFNIHLFSYQKNYNKQHTEIIISLVGYRNNLCSNFH